MTISFRNSTSLNQTAATTIVLNKPTGVVSGDVMYALLFSTWDATTHATLTGWTEVGFKGHTIFGESVTVLRRVAGGSEGSTYTFTSTVTGLYNGCIDALTGVDNTTPEDATMTATSSASGGNSASLVAPTITTVTNNAWWIAAFMTVGFNTETTLSLPTSFTNDVATYGTANILMRVDHQLKATAGATGTATSTSNAVDGYMTLSLAIRPSTAVNNFQTLPAATLSFTGPANLIKATSKGMAGILSLTGPTQLQKKITKLMSGVMSLTGTQVRLVSKIITATLGFAGALSNKALKSIAGVLSFVGALTPSKFASQILVGVMSFTGAISKRTGRLLGGGITFTGSLPRAISKLVAATLVFNGANLRLIKKTVIGGGLSFSGVLGSSRVFSKVIGAALSFAGNFTSISIRIKSLTAILTFTGTISRKISRSMTALLTLSGSFTKLTRKSFASNLTFIGLTNLARIHQLALNAMMTATATVGSIRWYTGTFKSVSRGVLRAVSRALNNYLTKDRDVD